MARAAHDRGEDSPGSIISCEASLAQARAIVTHERGGLLFTHGECGQVNQGLEHLGSRGRREVVSHLSKSCWRQDSWFGSWSSPPARTQFHEEQAWTRTPTPWQVNFFPLPCCHGLNCVPHTPLPKFVF